MLLVVTWLFVFPLCSGRWTLKDRYEGIRNNTIRVYVRSAGVDGNEEFTDEEIKQVLMRKAKERSSVLLSYYIKSAGRGNERTAAVGTLPAAVAGASKLRFFRCRGDYCEAFVDFDVKEMMQSVNDGKKEQGRSAE